MRWMVWGALVGTVSLAGCSSEEVNAGDSLGYLLRDVDGDGIPDVDDDDDDGDGIPDVDDDSNDECDGDGDGIDDDDDSNDSNDSNVDDDDDGD